MPAAPNPPARAPGRRPELDALRGVAALSVLAFHAWLYSLPTPDAATSRGGGDIVLSSLRVGLVLFFVLSGFLLYGPWVRAALESEPAPRLGRYLRRRALRVAPAYYAALAGAVLLLWGLDGTPGVRLPAAGHLWRFAALAQNYGADTVMTLNPPTWTLVVEVSFYLALPLIGAVAVGLGARRGAQAAVPVALMLVGLAFNAWLAAHRDLPPTLTKTLPSALPCFGAGMLAAVVLHGRRVPGRRAAAAAAGGAGLLVLNAWWHRPGSAGFGPVAARDALAAAGFALLLAAAVSEPVRRRLDRRPLVGLGTVSYGLYLWHVPLLLWLRAHGLLPGSPLAALAVAGPLSGLAAVASWCLVERPALARGRRRAARRPVAAAAAS
jgi:acetyltransferase